jgi:hypothetical protein
MPYENIVHFLTIDSIGLVQSLPMFLFAFPIVPPQLYIC